VHHACIVIDMFLFVRLFLVCNSVESTVLQKNVTVTEMDSVQLSCSTTFNKEVYWRVRTVLHDDKEDFSTFSRILVYILRSVKVEDSTLQRTEDFTI
jgi:hypothetical protein